MNLNKFIRVLCSLPIVFIILYFIPFLGICLICLRKFVYEDKKKYSTSISIIVIGFIILIPLGIDFVITLINSENIIIPYLNDITQSTIYDSLLEYSKFLLVLGVILLIISYVSKNLFDKIKNHIWSLFHYSVDNRIKMEREIDKENDLYIKLKQQRAKNTNYIKCPNCGSDNILSEKTGICKYCRRVIENKNYDKEDQNEMSKM